MTDGIIPINKPEGLSSARAVARVKKKLGLRKVGHTGTLDPFATGLLLCCTNKGTKISKFFLGSNKTYTARICLGIETDTYDRTGRITAQAPQESVFALSPADIEKTVLSFTGVQQQIPPVFSALKHKGQPLYRLARQGRPVVKPARTIEIFDIALKGIDLPCLDIEISCSSGTYIRTLGYDIGRKLGCGAHLSELCRTGSGSFTLDQAVGLDELEQMDNKEKIQKIVPLSTCLEFMPMIRADRNIAVDIRFGRKLSIAKIGSAPEAVSPGQPIRVVQENNEVIAIITLDENLRDYNYSCVFTD